MELLVVAKTAHLFCALVIVFDRPACSRTARRMRRDSSR